MAWDKTSFGAWGSYEAMAIHSGNSKYPYKYLSWARGYKTSFMLNSAENEICSAYKKLNTVNLNFLPAQYKWALNFSC